MDVIAKRTAYLVIFVEVETGRFKGAGIFSEDGRYLTMDGSAKVTPATVFDCVGETYQEAYDAVMANCRMFRHLQWLIPHIEKRGVYRGSEPTTRATAAGAGERVRLAPYDMNPEMDVPR